MRGFISNYYIEKKTIIKALKVDLNIMKAIQL